MRNWLLDIIACPVCKSFPMKLNVSAVKEVSRIISKDNLCQEYCGLRDTKITEDSTLDCRDCLTKEVITGLLSCAFCSREYSVIEGIPSLLPDDLKEEEVSFSVLLLLRGLRNPIQTSSGALYAKKKRAGLACRADISR